MSLTELEEPVAVMSGHIRPRHIHCGNGPRARGKNTGWARPPGDIIPHHPSQPDALHSVDVPVDHAAPCDASLEGHLEPRVPNAPI